LADAPGPQGVPLSGGLDSRCILAALLECGCEVKTFSIGDDDSPDVQLAGKVSRALGVPYQSWVLTPRDFLSWVEDGVYLADGMCGAFDTHILFVARNLPPDVHVVFDGTSSFDGMYSCIDVTLARYLRRSYPELRQALWVFTKPLVSEHGGLAFGELFTDDFRTRAGAYVSQTLAELLASVPPEETNPFDRTDCLEQTLRVPRFNMMGTVLLRTCCDVRHPFHHPDVVDYIRRLPATLRVKEKPVLRRVINQRAPQLRSIPWERTGLAPSVGTLRILARYGERVVRRSARRLLPARLLERGRRRGVGIDYGRWLTQDCELQSFVRDVLLAPRCLQRGYLRAETLQRLVDDQLSGHVNRLPLLSRLIGLELWHRSFVDAAPTCS
jgi:asparagine synthetase B (glutamine-hydrolysing)